MAGRHSQGPDPAMFSNVVIAGGTFNQHIVNNLHRGLDLLQQATASGAFHNSGERYDPPKCHPNTRLAVMKTIVDWTLGLDEESRGKFMMWLTGAAGAGKSAILQSFAEQQDSEGRLLASFFFGKSDSNRNHVRKLVATLAYQIHAKIPDVRQHMILAIDQDPLIFTRSLITQFTTLIIQPLQDSLLLESRFFDQPLAPRVIIIDGLDECIDHGEQKDVLLTISKVTQEYQLPILFLISSRPEHDISMFFSSQLQSISTRLDLDETFSPEKDIELYLRDKFNEIKANHPLRRFLPSSWPSCEDVQQLVGKSSGQFIYAATVIKYVGSTRHRPHHRLEVVLSIRPLTLRGEQPFAELDALYTHILMGVAEDSVSVVLRVLCFIFDSYSYRNLEVAQIETILQLEPGQVSLSFCDLGALISVVDNPQVLGANAIKILHASIRDFLLDPERSHDFHIRDEYTHENIISCVRFLSTGDFRSGIGDDILWFFAAEYFEITPDVTKPIMFATSLLQELKHFSISRFYESAPHRQIFAAFHNSFLPAMLSFLEDSDLKEAQEIYTHHLRVFKECFLSQLMEVDAYHSKTRRHAQFALHLALVCHYPSSELGHRRSKRGKYATVPSDSLQYGYKLHNLPFPHTDEDPTDVHYTSKQYLVYSPFRSKGYHCQGYIKLISHICPSGRLDKFEFEGNPGLENSWREFGKEVFAGAARCSFEYLCGNQDFEEWSPLPQQKIGFNAYFSSLRRNWPSKWLRNFGNKGACRAKKKWQLVQSLKNPRGTVVVDEDNPSATRRFLALRKLKSRPIYPQLYFYRPDYFHGYHPSMWGFMRYEKYLLALRYLVLFLPMAGKSESLLQLLRTKAFSQRSYEYPKHTKKARRVIDNYLARMDPRMSE